MLKRLYTDNFRCLNNFELSLDEQHLFLGANGSGKSAVFSVLFKIFRFVVLKEASVEVFPADDLSKIHLGGSAKQIFELHMEGDEGTFLYKLTIEHEMEKKISRVFSESLELNHQPLFKYEHGHAFLYNDKHQPGPEFPMDWTKSGVGFLMERPSNKNLTWFKKRLGNICVIKINPYQMGAEAREENEFLDLDMTNFTAWYWANSMKDAGKLVGLFQALSDVIPGFEALNLQTAGTSKILSVAFKNGQGGARYSLTFDRLSEGQRALVALYALVHFLPDGGLTLCLDEPDNFLALPEIQPLLNTLDNFCEERGRQVLMISHNPRIIDFMTKDLGVWFSRDGCSGPTRAQRMTTDPAAGFPLSDLIERGWLTLSHPNESSKNDDA